MELNRIFAYGILKRGFEADLRHMGARFMYEGYIDGATLYNVGANVSGLVNTQDPSMVVYGEVFEIPAKPQIWAYLDKLEGVDQGLYKRIALPVTGIGTHTAWGIPIPDVTAWVYEFNQKEFPSLVHHIYESGRFEYEF